ncbi:MAG: SDR family oxidoreductase [Micavibrio sp.]|nr:SDR family oxidoreductase [Micavibrio sp.]
MKIALITGGSRGLGKSMATHVAARGTGVVLTYNSHPEEAEAVAAGIKKAGGKAAALKLNIADTTTFDDFAKDLQATLQKEWGRQTFDYLVNNAGTAQRTPIKDTTEEQFDQLLQVHCKGPFFLTQKLMSVMEDGGHIINISSGLTRFTNTAGVATYAAMKGAMEVYTMYFAREYAHRKIRVNTVAPGAIDTQFAGPNGRSEEQKKMLADMTALGRCGEADDIGLLVAGLLSEDSRWVNAQRIEASGGMHI